MIIYLGCMLPDTSSDTLAYASTVLHTDRHLAVSAELNRIVSVRSPMVAHDGYYPLPVRIKSLCVRTFLYIYCYIQRSFGTTKLLYSNNFKMQFSLGLAVKTCSIVPCQYNFWLLCFLLLLKLLATELLRSV